MITKLKDSDFFKIEVRPELQKELDLLKSKKELRAVYFNYSPFFALKDEADTSVIMIYGMISNGFGTYTPMLLPSASLDKHKLLVIKCIYDYVQKYVGNDIRRFEASCDVTDKTAIRFAKWFGFETIGIRRDATCSGSDQLILERLFRK